MREGAIVVIRLRACSGGNLIPDTGVHHARIRVVDEERISFDWGVQSWNDASKSESEGLQQHGWDV